MTKFELMSKKAEKQKELEELKLDTFVLNDKIKGIINEINFSSDIFNFEVAASYLLGSGVGIGLLAIINNYIKINKQKNNLNKSNDNLVLRLKKRANTRNK